MTKLTEEQAKEAKECFSLFDRDQDGYLISSEFPVAVRSLGINVTEQKLQELINIINEEKNGKLDFAEFLSYISSLFSDKSVEQQLKEAFDFFDKDKLGFIYAKELKHLLTTIGEKLTPEEADKLIADSNPNKDGKIDFKNFVRVFT